MQHVKNSQPKVIFQKPIHPLFMHKKYHNFIFYLKNYKAELSPSFFMHNLHLLACQQPLSKTTCASLLFSSQRPHHEPVLRYNRKVKIIRQFLWRLNVQKIMYTIFNFGQSDSYFRDVTALPEMVGLSLLQQENEGSGKKYKEIQKYNGVLRDHFGKEGSSAFRFDT